MSEFKFPIQNPYANVGNPYDMYYQRPTPLDDSPNKFDPDDPDSWIIPDDDYSDSGISTLESGVRGLGQGATFGFEDEIRGGILGGYDALTGDESFSDAYSRNRDEIRTLNEQAREANPAAYMGGEVLGGIASGVAAAPLTGGASFAGGAARMAGTLGAQGAVAGLGYSEAEDLGGMATSAAIGGVLGAGLGTGAAYGMRGLGRKIGGIMGGSGEALQSAVSKLPGGIASIKIGSQLMGKAEKNAAKLLGATDDGFSENELRSLGRYALDSELLKNPTPEGIRRALLTETDNLHNAMNNPNNEISKAFNAIGIGRSNPILTRENIHATNLLNDIPTNGVTDDTYRYITNGLDPLDYNRIPDDVITEAIKKYQDALAPLYGNEPQHGKLNPLQGLNYLYKQANYKNTSPTVEEQAARIAHSKYYDITITAFSELENKLVRDLKNALYLNSVIPRSVDNRRMLKELISSFDGSDDYKKLVRQLAGSSDSARRSYISNIRNNLELISLGSQQTHELANISNIGRLAARSSALPDKKPTALNNLIHQGMSGVLGFGAGYIGGGTVTDDPTLQAMIGAGGAALGARAGDASRNLSTKLSANLSTKGLEKVGRVLGGQPYTRPNVQYNSAGERVLDKVPTPSQTPQTSNLKEKFGKFAGVLEKAKEKGQHNFAITYQALFNQSEEFRKLVRNSEEDE